MEESGKSIRWLLQNMVRVDISVIVVRIMIIKIVVNIYILHKYARHCLLLYINLFNP